MNLCNSTGHNHSLAVAFSLAFVHRSPGIHRQTALARRLQNGAATRHAKPRLRLLRTFCAGILLRARCGDEVEFAALRHNPTEWGIGSITPLLRILSARAVSLALAAPQQLATLLFFVANKPHAVCACLVLGAAVPRHLYRLKCDKRNLDWRIICPLMPRSCLPCSRFLL